MMFLVLEMSSLDLKAVQVRTLGLLLSLLAYPCYISDHVLHEHVLRSRTHRVVISEVRLRLLILKNDYMFC